VITTTLPGSSTPSLLKVTPVRPSSVLATSRGVTTPINKVALQPKTLLTGMTLIGHFNSFKWIVIQLGYVGEIKYIYIFRALMVAISVLYFFNIYPYQKCSSS